MQLEARADRSANSYRAGFMDGYLSAQQRRNPQPVGDARKDAWGYGHDAGVVAYEQDRARGSVAT